MQEKSGSQPRFKLRVRQEDRETVFPLDAFPCTIGRAPDCTIVLKDPSVSSRHATIDLEGDDRLVIHDENSTNGTFVDGRRVMTAELFPPCRIRMGLLEAELLPGRPVKPSGEAAKGAPPLPPPAVEVAPEAQCFFRREGREHGPFTFEQLREMAAQGMLRRTDLVWVPARDEWLRADLVPGLFTPPVRAEAAAQEPPGPKPPSFIEELTKGVKRRRKSGTIICPHCWHTFDVEEFLFIARHQSLVGDPVLGPDAPQRFLPSRFTPEGNAIDSMGMSCPDVACPRCHLRIPRQAGEMPPLFLSIVGAPASGKSYFLTAMVWELRNKLAQNFAIAFTDTDAINNQILNEFEETLFLNSDPDQLVMLRKTELQGELYNQVLLDGMIINLPKPFMFTIMPAEHHPNYEEVKERMSRTLVLYDNAGEHFEPGMDSVDNPTTRHLLHSDIIFFLFDPTKDVRFRRLCHTDDPQLAPGARVQRQETLLTEMINRIKKYSGMRADAKTAKTLIIVVPKFDVWRDLLPYPISKEPWRWEPRFNMSALDIEEIMNVSLSLRHLLQKVCPELVATAESFAGDVLYLPNSALGRSPELDPETGLLGIRPRDIRPFWITAPMLYFFYERGFIPAIPRKSLPERDLVRCEVRAAGDVVFVFLPNREIPLQVPVHYQGFRLRDPETGVWFELPRRRRSRRSAS